MISRGFPCSFADARFRWHGPLIASIHDGLIAFHLKDQFILITQVIEGFVGKFSNVFLDRIEHRNYRDRYR